ncbi:MAG: hypothetical protein S4CHLAM7_02330 [Chlamydiae bacterium]|nr:hypothetical protein [Chlamydiota bacterium]
MDSVTQFNSGISKPWFPVYEAMPKTLGSVPQFLVMGLPTGLAISESIYGPHKYSLYKGDSIKYKILTNIVFSTLCSAVGTTFRQFQLAQASLSSLAQNSLPLPEYLFSRGGTDVTAGLVTEGAKWAYTLPVHLHAEKALRQFQASVDSKPSLDTTLQNLLDDSDQKKELLQASVSAAQHAQDAYKALQDHIKGIAESLNNNPASALAKTVRFSDVPLGPTEAVVDSAVKNADELAKGWFTGIIEKLGLNLENVGDTAIKLTVKAAEAHTGGAGVIPLEIAQDKILEAFHAATKPAEAALIKEGKTLIDAAADALDNEARKILTSMASQEGDISTSVLPVFNLYLKEIKGGDFKEITQLCDPRVKEVLNYLMKKSDELSQKSASAANLANAHRASAAEALAQLRAKELEAAVEKTKTEVVAPSSVDAQIKKIDTDIKAYKPKVNPSAGLNIHTALKMIEWFGHIWRTSSFLNDQAAFNRELTAVSAAYDD